MYCFLASSAVGIRRIPEGGVANPEQSDQRTGAGAADLETGAVPVRDWSCSSAA